MIIGVDAGALSVNDERLKVGVYRVVLHLLRELSKRDTKNTYRLYSFKPIEEGILKLYGSRMSNVVLPAKGWFQVWVPLELRRHPVDLFLGLSQALPFFLGKSIGFVYDLGFLHIPDAYPDSYQSLSEKTESMVKRSNQLIAISKSTATDLIATYHISKERVTVCYPGIDDSFTSRGAEYTHERPYFLFVGALKRGKNIPTLLRAFAQFQSLSKKSTDLFLVGGDYWPDPNIVSVIQKLRIGKNVRCLGFVSDEQLPGLYRGATALVIPSLWEGFCLPAVEAMACGCPVVVSPAGALPEIVRNAGIVVRDNTPESFAKAMLHLSADTKTEGRCVSEGLRRAHVFSWKRMAEQVLNIIHSV